MEPVKLDDEGRWWRLAGHDIDLQNDAKDGLLIVHAAVLAFRDRTTPEHEDVSDLLLWTIDEHPPWAGQCATCGPQCETLGRSEYVAVEWLTARSRELIERSQANLLRWRLS